MTAQILVVDDEPDLELLIQQKFRHQIREGRVAFVFARDGVDALAQLRSNAAIDMVVAAERRDAVHSKISVDRGENRFPAGMKGSFKKASGTVSASSSGATTS